MRKTSVKKTKKLESIKKIVTLTKEKEFFILESLGLLTDSMQFNQRMQALTFSNDAILKRLDEIDRDLALVNRLQEWLIEIDNKITLLEKDESNE